MAERQGGWLQGIHQVGSSRAFEHIVVCEAVCAVEQVLLGGHMRLHALRGRAMYVMPGELIDQTEDDVGVIGNTNTIASAFHRAKLSRASSTPP